MAELMVTLGLFSILAAVAVPNYLAFQPGQRLNGGAREVLSKLRWARAKAVEENTRYVINFPNDHTLLIFSDTNLNDAADVGEWSETIDLQLNYSDVTFTVGGSTLTPKFNGRGTASGSTTITLTNSSGSKVVDVTPTGNVKIN